MNFLRLSDLWLSVLFEDDDIIAVDKAYGFNAHTNDSKTEHSDYIQDGLIEIYEKQFGRRLYIIHRLDQTTTGVMIFGKSPESAKKYAEFFFNRQVHKTYWFITKSRSTQNTFTIDKTIIHKAKELESLTDLSLIEKGKNHELWEAKPHTGRNHQIRIHSQTAGIPILGDGTYDGAPFPFICLHNCKIEFPNGITITSNPPEYFKNIALLEDIILTKMLFETDRRQRLFAFSRIKNACFRLATVHCNKEDVFFIDQLGPQILVQWYKTTLNEHDLKRFQYYSDWLQTPVVIHLQKDSKEQNNRFTVCYPSNLTRPAEFSSHSSQLKESDLPNAFLKWIAVEGDSKYEIRCENNSYIGLSTDQRLQRDWLKQNAKNKTVLNLFSQFGGYSISAALGQAQQITLVDLSKNLLNISRVNFQLNELSADAHKFYCRDSASFIEMCSSKEIKYDVIVCDVPSFYRREKGVFKIENDLEKLLGHCLASINPQGHLMFSTRFDHLYIDDIRKMLIKIQTEKKWNLEITSILPALDLELPYERPTLKSFLIQLK